MEPDISCYVIPIPSVLFHPCRRESSDCRVLGWKLTWEGGSIGAGGTVSSAKFPAKKPPCQVYLRTCTRAQRGWSTGALELFCCSLCLHATRTQRYAVLLCRHTAVRRSAARELFFKPCTPQPVGTAVWLGRTSWGCAGAAMNAHGKRRSATAPCLASGFVLVEHILRTRQQWVWGR